MAMRKPAPSPPMRFATGTLTPSKNTAHVGCVRHPSLRSCFPNDSPGVPASMARHVIPSAPLSTPPVRAITRYTSLRPPPLMKALLPVTT